MRFTLTIELGNDARDRDIAEVLLSAYLSLQGGNDKAEIGTGGRAFNTKGEPKGEWKIEPTPEPQAAEPRRYTPDPELEGGQEAGRCLYCGQHWIQHRFKTLECLTSGQIDYLQKQQHITKLQAEEGEEAPHGRLLDGTPIPF